MSKLVESCQVEFKKSIKELREAVISLASMLNKSYYGELYFGIDNNGKICGCITDINTISTIVKEVTSSIYPTVHPKVMIISLYSTVIKVVVEGDLVPYSAYGKYYLRRDINDNLMTFQELSYSLCTVDYKQDRLTYSKDTFIDIDEEILIQCIDQGNKSGRINYRYKDIKDCLSYLGYPFSIYVPYDLKLMFGMNGDIYLHFIYYDELDNEEYEVIFIKTCLFRAIECSISFLKSHLRCISINGTNDFEIPFDALKEAVINSLIHRDFDNPNPNVIMILNNKVSIYNPGKYYTNSINTQSFGQSIIRNSYQYIMIYKLGFIDLIGNGMKIIDDTCSKRNTSYRFYYDNNGYCIDFIRNDYLVTDLSTSYFEDLLKTKYSISLNLTESENLLLKYFIQHGKLKNVATCASQLHLSRITIQRALHKLILYNIIIRVGTKKEGYWKVVRNND